MLSGIWQSIFSCLQIPDSIESKQFVTGAMETNTKQGACLCAYIWLVEVGDSKSQSCFLVKTVCICIFKPRLDSHYCSFPRISCFLSDTWPYLSLYDILFHVISFLSHTNTVLNRNNHSAFGKMAGEHTGRLSLPQNGQGCTQPITTKCSVVQTWELYSS